MYKVIKSFADLKDNKWMYGVGDIFPRAGTTATTERLLELSGYKNLLKEPLIKEVSDNGNDGTVQGTEELVRDKKVSRTNKPKKRKS